MSVCADRRGATLPQIPVTPWRFVTLLETPFYVYLPRIENETLFLPLGIPPTALGTTQESRGSLKSQLAASPLHGPAYPLLETLSEQGASSRLSCLQFHY